MRRYEIKWIRSSKGDRKVCEMERIKGKTKEGKEKKGKDGYEEDECKMMRMSEGNRNVCKEERIQKEIEKKEKRQKGKYIKR